MRWRGLEVGPVLCSGKGGEIRVGLEAGAVPVALRWFPASHAGDLGLPSLPFPPQPAPNVSRVLRVERSGAGVVVASELALGPTIELLLSTPQPPPVVAGVSAQLLAALEALHAQGRAHGRVHPGNLVLDVHAATIRLVDVCATSIEGVAAGDDPRKAYRPPGALGRPPTAADDVYGAGRVAEALLRGGPPLGGWDVLAVPETEAPVRPGAVALVRWIHRCQGLGPEASFATASEALAALRALGEPSDRGVAHVRLGPWVTARRRAERTLARWRVAPRREAEAPAEYPELLSSLRAAALWKRLGFAAAGAALVSALVASSPHVEGPAARASWPEDGCVEAARPAVLGQTAPAPAGGVVLELLAPAGTPVAVDGCPLSFPAGGSLRLAVSPGTHELRAKPGASTVARGVTPGLPWKLAGLRAAPASSEAAKHVQEALVALPSRSAPPRNDPGDPWRAGLLDPLAAGALTLAQTSAAAPGTRAALPDSLALVLDGLRAAGDRVAHAERPCTDQLRKKVAEVLAVRQPQAGDAVREAVAALAAARLEDGEGRAEVGAERAIRRETAVPESPMLAAAVDDVAADDALRRCVETLNAPAEDVTSLAQRAVSEAGGALALIERESSEGSSP